MVRWQRRLCPEQSAPVEVGVAMVAWQGRGSGREGDGVEGRGGGAACSVERSPLITEAYVGLILFNETAALFMTNKV